MSTTDKTRMEGIELDLLEVVPLLNKKLLRMAEVRECLDMPLSHIQVLCALARQEGMSVTEISQRFDIAKPNITPLIDHLTEAGWVERKKGSHDRRVVYIEILPAGREKVDQVLKAVRERIKLWSSSLAQEEYERLADALSNVVKILGKL